MRKREAREIVHQETGQRVTKSHINGVYVNVLDSFIHSILKLEITQCVNANYVYKILRFVFFF